VRGIVPDVDRLWEVARRVGVSVERALADRGYGLRDCTIVDPDGFDVRFAQVRPPAARAVER